LNQPPTGSRRHREEAYARGRRAERLASLALALKGYRILGSRVRTPVVELDLVVRRGTTVAFVEVKARDSLAAAVEAVVPRLRRRIVRAAHVWLAANPRYACCTLRFDIVVVRPWRWPIHLPNSFEADQ